MLREGNDVDPPTRSAQPRPHRGRRPLEAGSAPVSQDTAPKSQELCGRRPPGRRPAIRYEVGLRLDQRRPARTGPGRGWPPPGYGLNRVARYPFWPNPGLTGCPHGSTHAYGYPGQTTEFTPTGGNPTALRVRCSGRLSYPGEASDQVT